MKMPRGFISMGHEGAWLNIDVIVNHIDRGDGTTLVVCKDNQTFIIPTDCVEGRL